MDWLKHEISARKDVKLKKLKRRFGAEGYGVYFQLIEIIAENIGRDCWEWGFVDKEHDVETLADEVGVDKARLEEILSYCNELNLLYKVDGRLCCPQILQRLDRYSTGQAGKTPGFSLDSRKEELTQAWINGLHTKGTLAAHKMSETGLLIERIEEKRGEENSVEESVRGERIAASAAVEDKSSKKITTADLKEKAHQLSKKE